MNIQLCYADAYAREIEARVVAVEAAGSPLVVLDSTVFYPGGGGQPTDRGILLRREDGRTWAVQGARKAGGEIVHELEAGSSRRRSATGCGWTSTGRAAMR